MQQGLCQKFVHQCWRVYTELLIVTQGPAAHTQQLHEEEVRTLVSEAVQAKEAEHAADLMRLQQDCKEQLSESEEDQRERDRYCCCSALLPMLGASIWPYSIWELLARLARLNVVYCAWCLQHHRTLR